jgi:hypothetical protein
MIHLILQRNSATPPRRNFVPTLALGTLLGLMFSSHRPSTCPHRLDTEGRSLAIGSRLRSAIVFTTSIYSDSVLQCPVVLYGIFVQVMLLPPPQNLTSPTVNGTSSHHDTMLYIG